MTETDRFSEFVDRRDAERAASRTVGWRRARLGDRDGWRGRPSGSPYTLFVTPPTEPGGINPTEYLWGTAALAGVFRVRGHAPNLSAAKVAAAEWIRNATEPEEGTMNAAATPKTDEEKRAAKAAKERERRARIKAEREAVPSPTTADVEDAIRDALDGDPTAANAIADAVAPVVELPASDPTPADLAASVRAYVEEATEAIVDVLPAPNHERWQVEGKTIAYVRVGSRGASVEVKNDSGPGPRTLVKTADEVAPVGRELAKIVQAAATVA